MIGRTEGIRSILLLLYFHILIIVCLINDFGIFESNERLELGDNYNRSL